MEFSPNSAPARWIARAIGIGIGALFLPGAAAAGEIFRDVTGAAGIRFVQEIGAVGKKHLIETMAGGAAWIDYDGDGFLDLYIVQAHSDVDNAIRPGKERDVLFRNRGDGTFEDASARAGVGDPGYGGGAAVGDIDNDGRPDLYVTNYGRNTLYHNLGGGRFEDITEAAGVACPLWSTSAAFCDLDGDGILDLYVDNYLEYDTRVHKACTGNEKKIPGYCHPNKFRGAPDALYRGLGGGRFEDISQRTGVAVAGMFSGKGLGVLPTDFDGDGDIDLLVACDSVPNILWRNLGGLTFEDAALEVGIALDPNGKALAGMGIDGGDVDGDGHLDITITNFSKEPNSLFLWNPAGYFTESSAVCGIAAPTFLPLGFGCRLIDFDLDGDLDLYYACGHVSDTVEITSPGGGEVYAQADILLENDGRGKFRDISAQSGEWFSRKLVGRGAAFADYDNDGDIDIFIVNMKSSGVLLRNEQRSGNHWIGLQLEGDGARINRDGYGAKVTVVSAGGAARRFEARSAGSYLAANDPRVLCGLGKEESVDRVEVVWPGGAREIFRGLAPDRYHRLRHGSGEPDASRRR